MATQKRYIFIFSAFLFVLLTVIAFAATNANKAILYLLVLMAIASLVALVFFFQKIIYTTTKSIEKTKEENILLQKSIRAATIEFVIIDNKTNQIVYSTKPLDQLNNYIAKGKCVFEKTGFRQKCKACKLHEIFEYQNNNETIEINYEDRWFLCKNKAIKLNDNNEYTLVYLKDATAQKELLNKLLLAELDFKQILEAFPVAVVITNENHQSFLFNNASMNLFESDAKQMSDINVIRKFKLKKISEHNSYTSISDLEKYKFLNSKNQEVTIYKKEVPITLQEIEGYLQTYIDITPIELALKGEEKANRAKSEFLANMSHEIRSPMNAVVGLADVLLNHEMPANQKEYVGLIRKSADHLLSVINDILDFSKIEAGMLTLEEIPFNIREEIEFVANSNRLKAKDKGIDLIVDINNDLSLSVIGDPFRLRQVITNLVSNSLKFTDNGKIIISVEEVKHHFETVTYLFSVEDTGIGISKDKQLEIFKSFSQADNSTTRRYGGTGLGTTISKELVEMMEGEIWVESPGNISKDPKNPGSKFSFTCELMPDRVFEKNIMRKNVTSFEDFTIMVVEEHGSKHSLKDTLENLSINVVVKNEINQVIDYLKKKKGSKEMPCIIFIEHSETYDGFKAAKALEEIELVDEYIIAILSSNDETGNYARSKRLKVDYYIIKPYEIKDITGIITENFSQLQIETATLDSAERLAGSLSILVAEDNRMNQRVAQIIFKNIGYEIDIAENGNQVLDKIKNKSYDIIFMDFIMPHKDGIETTIELRKKGVKIPIVAMTGKATDEDEKLAYQAGMDGFITKPVTINSIKKWLSKWFIRNAQE